MRRLLALLCVSFAIAHYSFAQITSTFDTDTDGWTFTSPITVNHSTTNGNPGGFVYATYSSNQSVTYQHWIAPAKFIGNHVKRSFGMKLRFDLQQSIAGTANSYEVIIRNGGNNIYQTNLNPKPAVAPDWTSYSFTLDETGGWLYQTGVPATREQIKHILTNVTAIEIRGTYATNANYTSGLDNVVLEQRILEEAPTITSFTPESAKPGENVTVTGTGFSAFAADNIVHFNGVAATITNASATQLSVTVPYGAQYGQITVTNKTIGLSAESPKPFVPTFEGGGRIIPASFKPRVDIMTAARPNGVVVADMDGDGWNDLLIALGNNTVLVYKNPGTKSQITTSSFELVATLTGAGNASGLFVSDLDADGMLDIIAGYTSASLTHFATFRNMSTPGNFSFGPAGLWPGLVYSGYVSAVADIDGDGLPELIGQHGNGSVAPDFWIAQNMSKPGVIELCPSVSYFGASTLDAGAGVSVGDLNGDGKPEIIVKHSFGDRFTILPNLSTPAKLSFGDLIPFNNGSNGNVVMADFNRDGKTDIVWKQGNNMDVHIRLNTNSGGALTSDDLTTQVIVDSELGNYGATAIGDINGDGKPDVVTADAANVGVFENVYSGGQFDASAFVPAYLQPGAGGSTYPSNVIAADLNNDGKPEIIMAITNSSPNRVAIYENQNAIAPVISSNTITPLQGAVGSTVTITGSHFSPVPSQNKVWFGGVEGTVLTASENQITATVPAGANYERISVTRDELTSMYHLPFNTTFSSGTTFNASSFLPPIAYPLTGADYDVEVADLNNDGKPEIVAESRIVTGIIRNYGLSYRNVHSGGTITETSFVLDDTTATSARNLKLLDVDGDNRPDILSPEGIYRNISTSNEIAFETNVGIASSGLNHSWADFNRDGKLDIVTTLSNNIAVFENRVRRPEPFVIGTFAQMSASVNIPKPAADGSVVAADFDGDGWAEFAATNPGSDNMRVWRNTGSYRVNLSQFEVAVDLTTGDNPGRVYAGDLDVDGKIDLMIYHGTGTNATMITVFRNTSSVGNISFTRTDYTIPAAAAIAHINDLDGDGRPEIIVTSESTDQFFILKNTSAPGVINASSFAAAVSFAVNNPRGLTSADLNADGKPEVIVTSAPNSLLIFENAISSGTITITTHPSSTSACEGNSISLTASATGTDNITYRWQKRDGADFVDLNEGSGYSGTTTATLTINTGVAEGGEFRARINGTDAAQTFTNSAPVTVNPIPDLPAVEDGVSCGPGTAQLLASGASDGEYRWYDAPSGGNVLGTTATFMTPVLNTTTSYYVSIEDASCQSARAEVKAHVVSVPTPDVEPSINPAPGSQVISFCEGNSAVLSAPEGFSSYLWSNGQTSRQITVTESGTYSVLVTDANGCESSPSDEVEVSVLNACNNLPPIIQTALAAVIVEGVVTIDLTLLISDPDNNLDLSTLRLPVSQSEKGASATIGASNELMLSYSGVLFTGVDHVLVEVCDFLGECTQENLEIEVVGDVIIFNGFSPNGDGKNDFFYLKYIDLFADTRTNRVTIYNRWGDLVFEMNDYNNADRVFNGQGKNGKDLPSGVYFYKIEFTGSRGVKSGYLSLKR